MLSLESAMIVHAGKIKEAWAFSQTFNQILLNFLSNCSFLTMLWAMFAVCLLFSYSRFTPVMSPDTSLLLSLVTSLTKSSPADCHRTSVMLVIQSKTGTTLWASQITSLKRSHIAIDAHWLNSVCLRSEHSSATSNIYLWCRNQTWSIVVWTWL